MKCTCEPKMLYVTSIPPSSRRLPCVQPDLLHVYRDAPYDPQVFDSYELLMIEQRQLWNKGDGRQGVSHLVQSIHSSTEGDHMCRSNRLQKRSRSRKCIIILSAQPKLHTINDTQSITLTCDYFALAPHIRPSFQLPMQH